MASSPSLLPISPSSSSIPTIPSSSSLLTPPPLSSSNAPPPSISNSPPPSASPPPPSLPNAPPPSTNSPPPASPSPPPPTSLSPPPSSPPPPTPSLTPPPQPQANPPSISPPPPSTPTLPPPTPQVSSPPPAIVTPPSPTLPLSPPPPRSADPPVPSPPTPVSNIPPPSNPLTPPPKSPPSSHPPSPPTNTSNGTPPSSPSGPSPPIASSPPPSAFPKTPPGDQGNQVSPNGNNSSTFGPNVTAAIGKGNRGGGGGVKAGVIVPVALLSFIMLLSLVGLAVWYSQKKKRRSGGYAAGLVMPSPITSSQMSESSYPRSPTAPLVHHSSGSHGYVSSSPDPGLGNSKSWFSYEELYNVTDGFSHQRLLGEGGFGCVYKGCLQDGREVAVKQLKVGGSQGEREFAAEVEIIGRVHHRHLVSLVGYCIADSQRLLVYDYVPNNTLDYHLHAKGRAVLDWATRVKIAAGAARGIAYLHEDCHPRIIHRDIKSSNILLDNSFEAQVSDFGLARLAMDAVTHVTTRVMGTFGYLAPEYASSGKLTERSDVYSFGVVLLELITGRKPVDTSQPLGDESLVEWARPLLTHALETGDFDGLPDPRLENNYNESEMFRMIEAAAACVRHSAAMRPRMGLVARALEGISDIDLNNGTRPGRSELFSAQSEDIRIFQRMAFGNPEYSSDFSNFSRGSWKSQRES